MTNLEIINNIDHYKFQADKGYEYYFTYDCDNEYSGMLSIDFSYFIPININYPKEPTTYTFTKDEQEYLKLKFL